MNNLLEKVAVKKYYGKAGEFKCWNGMSLAKIPFGQKLDEEELLGQSKLIE